MKKMDFQALAASLLTNWSYHLPTWLPGGKLIGKEYSCGDLTGTPGQSLKVNIDTGVWKDFSEGSGGADLISLYAAINNLKQGAAYEQLGGLVSQEPQFKDVTPVKKKEGFTIELPRNERPPDEVSRWHYNWEYKTEEGETIGYVLRKDDPDTGKKNIRPYFYSKGDWHYNWPSKNRPLYGLEQIALKKKNAQVILCEGEKATEAARKFCQSAVIMCWPGGGSAWDKTDWTPIAGRDVIIWPDNDRQKDKDGTLKDHSRQPGWKNSVALGLYLLEQSERVRIIDIRDINDHDGWDAADSGFVEYEDFKDFASGILINAEEFIPPPPPIPAVVEPQQQTTIINAEVMVASDDALEKAPPTAHQILYQQLDMTQTEKGVAHANVANTLKILKYDMNIRKVYRIWYDSFKQKVFTTFRVPKTERKKGRDYHEWKEHLITFLLDHLQSRSGHNMTQLKPKNVEDAVMALARTNEVSSAMQWIKSLNWDGTKRVHSFFDFYYGAQDPEGADGYTEVVSKNFLVSMVARVMEPGCKVDNMVVIEGAQGIRKSSSLQALVGPDWYTEVSESPDNKDFYMKLNGHMLVEIAELDSFRKASIESIKKMLTVQTDKFRAPYGKFVAEFPRQSVFVGTTNDNEYLQDATGARRFWPITSEKINYLGIKKDREQLFAEAYEMYQQGYEWWTDPPGQQKVQESRREKDLWEENVSVFLDGKNFTWPGEIIDFLEIPKERRTKLVAIRISYILKALGWRRDEKTRRVNSKTTTRVWYAPDFTGTWQEAKYTIDQEQPEIKKDPAAESMKGRRNHAPGYEHTLK